MRNESGRTGRAGSRRGFSAVEVMIALVVLSFLMVVGIRAFQGSRKMTRGATMKGNAQQNARNAVELATGDLRSLGFDLDLGNGQRGLVYAGPWDIIFNANILPTSDDPAAPAFPRAIDVTVANAAVPPASPLYVPATTFSTGAETIRYTLDSNGDGAVTAADQGDDPEEATANPRDFVLLREVYGVRADGTNGGNGEPVAILRGPLAGNDGTLPPPLLTYWLDHDDDPLTAEILHGDGDGDGVLSQAEIAAIGPVAAADLALVSRVVLNVTTEDRRVQRAERLPQPLPDVFGLVPEPDPQDRHRLRNRVPGRRCRPGLRPGDRVADPQRDGPPQHRADLPDRRQRPLRLRGARRHLHGDRARSTGLRVDHAELLRRDPADGLERAVRLRGPPRRRRRDDRGEGLPRPGHGRDPRTGRAGNPVGRGDAAHRRLRHHGCERRLLVRRARRLVHGRRDRLGRLDVDDAERRRGRPLDGRRGRPGGLR